MERVSAACCNFSKYCLATVESDGWQKREKESKVDENAEAAMGRRPQNPQYRTNSTLWRSYWDEEQRYQEP